MKSYGVLKRCCGFFSEPGCDDNPKGYMFMAENRWDGELGRVSFIQFTLVVGVG